MLLEDFRKTFDTDKVLRLLGAKAGRPASRASRRRIAPMSETVAGMVKPQLSFRTLSLSQAGRGRVRLEDGTCFRSPKLARALAAAEAVCCFLATVGPTVDREIQSLMRQKRYADAYVLDAMGSMSAESVVEQFYRRMARRQEEKRGGGVTLRFSPGYCDWPIQDQEPLFALFEEVDTPDVTLNERFLMSPRKSVSGLFGLLPPGVDGADPGYNPCSTCNKRNCIARRGHA
jgi:hypothetical protein